MAVKSTSEKIETSEVKEKCDVNYKPKIIQYERLDLEKKGFNALN